MKKYFYEVGLSWQSAKSGALNSHGLHEIQTDSPEGFPKEKLHKWTPEHLLAASLSSSFMSIFLSFAEANQLEVISYTSQCFVKLEKTEGKFTTTEILLQPTIKLHNELSIAKATSCMDQAENICPIRNALTFPVQIHPQFEYVTKSGKL